MRDRLIFFFNRLREKLWVKPLVMCFFSVAAVFLAKYIEATGVGAIVPNLTVESLVTLLSIISASMLVIATFAVASMVSAYASASGSATPRSFSLVISDDVSQNALSTFIGAFIFSIVALIAVQNGFFDQTGRFALFILTLVVFSIVIVTFVQWVDRIARLGRLGATIDKVEKATATAMKRRKRSPTMRGVPVGAPREDSLEIYADKIGYVQRIDISALQTFAEQHKLNIRIEALPGTFATPGQELACVASESGNLSDFDVGKIVTAFVIGENRIFDEDPRFGLIALSEISSRALSPAVNDPGTAIDVIGTMVRLFASWTDPAQEADIEKPACNRIEVPELSIRDMFDDAFNATARDGSGTVEVMVRLQKALDALASIGHFALRDAAFRHSRLALARAEIALDLPEDLRLVRNAASFSAHIPRHEESRTLQ